MRRYFRLRWVTPARPFLEADKRYLFLHFPHAVFPMGSWLSMGLTGNEGACMPGLVLAMVDKAPGQGGYEQASALCCKLINCHSTCSRRGSFSRDSPSASA